MPSIPASDAVKAVIKAAVDSALVSQGSGSSGAPPGARALVEVLSVPDAARDLSLILLAYRKVAGRRLDLIDPDGGDLGSNNRLRGDRQVSDWLRTYLRSLGIEARASAVESSTFRGGYLPAQTDRPVIHAVVRWISHHARTEAEIDQAFDFVVQRVASTARVVPPLPELSRQRCTFPRTMQVVDRLLATPSGGRFEQYLLGAFLKAVHDEREDRLRVETKAVGTTDRAAGTAGDIEIRRGQNLEDAFEVSGADWQTKVVQAVALLENRAELERIHVVALGEPTGDQILAKLGSADLPSGVTPSDVDMTVRHIRSVLASLAAEGGRHARKAAFSELHQLLRRHESPMELIEVLVDAVVEFELVDV